MKKLILLVLASMLLVNIAANTVEFKIKLKPKVQQCIYEFFQDNLLVILEIYSNIKLDYSFTDPDNKSLHLVENNKFFKFSFTTFSGGYYTICALNNLKNQQESNVEKEENFNGENEIIEREENNLLIANVKFNIKHGIYAKDYSTLSTMKNLKPIEKEVSIYSDIINILNINILS